MKLMGQFSPMFKQMGGMGGFMGGMSDPMGMVQKMLGPQKAQEFQQFLNQGRNSSSNPEEYARNMFQQSGLDLNEVRRMFGV